MASEDNLKPFSKDNQPKNRRSRKGIPNRATVYKRLLKMKTVVAHPETGDELKVTLYEAMAIGQIEAAAKGNTRAWQEIQDSLFGKTVEKHELTGEGGGPIPITIIEPIKPENV